jgi:D-amino peptidase
VRVFIHTDLEGVCSFYDWKEADIKTSRGILYTKEFLTQEVNAAVEGFFAADPNAEVVVEDGHGGGYLGPNMIAEALDPRARLLVGKFDRHLATLDASFDMVAMVGAHSMAGTRYGLMNHTLSKEEYYDIWVNGTKIGEIGICALIAGVYGVPLTMVAGDHWAVVEAKELLGNIQGASVKRGLNAYNAECLHPNVARALITVAAKNAALRRKESKPFAMKPPFEVKIAFMFTEQADKAEYHRGAKRLDGRTISYGGDDLLALLNKFLMA